MTQVLAKKKKKLYGQINQQGSQQMKKHKVKSVCMEEIKGEIYRKGNGKRCFLAGWQEGDSSGLFCIGKDGHRASSQATVFSSLRSSSRSLGYLCTQSTNKIRNFFITDIL
jgi:hypothetical protein